MSDHSTPTPGPEASQPGAARRLAAVLLGLTAVVTLMLCAFALPGVHGGPHRVPIGVTGPQTAAQALQKTLDGDAWDVTVYESAEALTSAIKDRDITGGMALASGGVDVYTATAGAPMAGGALTALGNTVAAQQQAKATVHDLVPYPEDDPRGAGFAAAGLPMIFGGIFPAVILTRLFPGHAGLCIRLAGAVFFSLFAGAAATAFLQYATGSLAGDYWLTALGLTLGMAALSMTFIGLEALIGMAGIGIGAVVMMLLGNPLSGLGTGPYWLPSGWAAIGRLLPPGASGSLLRANAFFDGTGAAGPALVLTVWVVLGLALFLVADRRGARATRAGGAAKAPEPAGV
ncbi:hypothetical protein C1I97_01855 [Streptomyces sp. NTH33]|uniref:hypothetical protein n=1 Tax=Streptomyces sp. NTH33 TaxID=1735453 RepID=UPI000DA78D93|nr:hypothetical protein [Streptomyces sp. NTH33]PZH20042.1 hypothetical protein C1I97_01855 [Streptomyces sp. NTH33]